MDIQRIHHVESPAQFKSHDNSLLLLKRHYTESMLLYNSRAKGHVCSRERVPENNGRTKSLLNTSFGIVFCNIDIFTEASASNELSEDEDKHMTPKE